MPASRRSTVLLWGLVGVVVLVVGLRTLDRDAGSPAAPATAAPRGIELTAEPERESERVVVDVTGEVRRPGVYRLPSGARVQEALRRAGGVTGDGDLASVNRAAKVADGQQIRVPGRAQTPAGGPAGAPETSGPVSLNAATPEQLDALDGVGPATAQKIIAWRTANGGFSSVDDLAQVPGIGPKRLEALRPQLSP